MEMVQAEILQIEMVQMETARVEEVRMEDSYASISLVKQRDQKVRHYAESPNCL